MTREQEALLEVMQEACIHGEQRDTDLSKMLSLITEKLTPVVKPE
ncbi:hypothetical protein [Domibacillus epiphyticus]|nr:hypothetical protein [Domibacillus epiphyticus]